MWNCAFDWVTSPSLSVLKDPVYSLFSNGTLWSNSWTEQKPHQAHLMENVWRWWKVSFVDVLFQISFQVRVHSPNSCTEMFLNSLHVELWFSGPDSKVSCHFHYAFLDLCLLQHFAVLLQIHSDQVKQVILMFHLWKRLVKSSTAS